MLNTKPSLPVRNTCLPDQLEENLRKIPDSQLYRMIYIEPGRYSSDEIRAAQLEMDRRAVPVKMVSGYRLDYLIDKNLNKPSPWSGSLLKAENLAPYAAMMGLVCLAVDLVFHWVDHKKISEFSIFKTIFWLMVSAAVYVYLAFRGKPTKPTRRK